MRKLISEWHTEGRRLLICPIDDSLIFGPENGLENFSGKIQKIWKGEPDAVMTFCGPLMKDVGFTRLGNVIVNLSASTTRSYHSRKVPVHSVELAQELGASGCAYHINLTSSFESEMLHDASKMVEASYKLGMPTMGIIYPRNEGENGDADFIDLKQREPEQYAELVRHCVSVGMNLGFDLIKTKFTGNESSFASVVESAGNIPVVAAGGPKIPSEELCDTVREICKAGAAGICFGRNIFGQEVPSKTIGYIREILDSE